MIEKSMRERMIAGEPYIANDSELTAMRLRAEHISHAFNNAHPDNKTEQRALAQQLFGSLGPGSEIRAPFHCDYGSNIFAGEQLYINFNCVILDCNLVHIGDRVLMGPNVQIYTATHSLDPTERKGGWEYALPVEIGSDVWLGGGVIVCPGVTIGQGSTIGAGSVVTRDIPPQVLAVGNPCRVIRKLSVD